MRNSSRSRRSMSARRFPHSRQLAFESLEQRRLLSVYSVSNLNDSGAGSLREAISVTNATTGADDIVFAPGLAGEISLGSVLPTILDDLTVAGDNRISLNAGNGIDGVFHTGDGYRIFNIGNQYSNTIDVTLSGLNLTGGDVEDGGGGAIFNAGASTLTIEHATISGNATFTNGGAIENGGTLTIVQSKIAGNSAENGGGISNLYLNDALEFKAGHLVLNATTLVGNSASTYGGGLYNEFLASIDSSNFLNNHSGFYGGGIYTVNGVKLNSSTLAGNAARRGGGIYSNNHNSGNSTNISNSTISDNVAEESGGGVYNYEGYTGILTSTITTNTAAADSGSGVFSFGVGFGDVSSSPTVTTVFGSLIAGNTGNDDVHDGFLGTNSPDAFDSRGFNLIGSGNGVAEFDDPDDLSNVTNPMLGALVDNGGPTWTRALLPGSPAIDMGDPTYASSNGALNSDQRGAPFARVADADGTGGARIDIGAYERQTVAGLNLVVDTTNDQSDGDYTAGNLALREAIGLANGSVGPNTITFSAPLAGQTIALGGTELAPLEEVTIDATALADNVTINAQRQSRIFDITAPTGDFTLAGLNLSGGRTTGFGDSGGAIRSFTAGTLTIEQCTVSGNSTTSDSARGGGIFADGALTLTQSTISDNSTRGYSADGGGIFANGALTLFQSTVSGNSTEGFIVDGGGIFANGALTVTQSTVTNNHALYNFLAGGGISVDNDPIEISGSILAGNTAGFNNTDLKSGAGTLTVNYSLIGTGISPDFGGNNISTGTPQLGPLADNGGPTWTHMLLPGSPAIDAGDPNFASPPTFDQRGAPFARVSGGRIDMGAFEVQPIADSADFNGDGDVDGRDFLAWQRGYGTPNASKADGDANHDLAVNGADLVVWQDQYGTAPPAVAAATAVTADSVLPATALGKNTWLSSPTATPAAASETREDNSAQPSSQAALVDAVFDAALEPRSIRRACSDSDALLVTNKTTDAAAARDEVFAESAEVIMATGVRGGIFGA